MRMQPTWASLGYGVEEAMNSFQALQMAGADFDVWLSPISADVNRPDEGIFSHPMKGYFATMRKHPTIPGEVHAFGVVGSRYTLIQNDTSFAYCDTLAEVSAGDAYGEGFNYHRCAALDMGRVLFISMKLPSYIKLNDYMDVETYVVLSTSHDGTRAFTTGIYPVLKQGQVTLNMQIAGARREWATRHTLNVHDRISAAKYDLGLITDYMTLFEERANQMMEKTISVKQFENICQKMYPDSDSKIGQSKADNTRAELMQIFKENDALEGARFTAWGAYTAFGLYFDHVREWGDSGAQKRAEGALFGRTMSQKDKALALIMKVK